MSHRRSWTIGVVLWVLFAGSLCVTLTSIVVTKVRGHSLVETLHR